MQLFSQGALTLRRDCQWIFEECLGEHASSLRTIVPQISSENDSTRGSVDQLVNHLRRGTLFLVTKPTFISQ